MNTPDPQNPNATGKATPPPPAPEAQKKNEVDRASQKLVLTDVPKRPWWKRLLMIGAWMALVGATAAICVVAALYLKYADGLPAIPAADQYFPPIITEVYTDDHVLAGEFYNERRKVIPYDRIPKRLVQAFIASEDSSFFDRMGVDVLGTGRAAFKTILKKATGKGSVQGGSTLTQQTAKAVLISAEGFTSATEKSMKRKIREAILALRLEGAMTKEQILYLYLNNVYLGHSSYGVQSAAENYFRKQVKDLTLAEMALIAGLPQAPSRYSPFRNPVAAKNRRSYVLGRMLNEGMITKAEHDEAQKEEIHVFPVEDVFHEFAPYFTEEVRKTVDRYGNPVLLREGLKVFTTMDSERQRAAQEAVLHGLLSVDKRQGFRGVIKNLKTPKEREDFIKSSMKVIGEDPITNGNYYVAMVTGVDPDGKMAHVKVGTHEGYLPLLGARWARPLNPELRYPNVIINSLKNVLHEGDLVVVSAVDAKQLWDDKEQYDANLEKNLPTDKTLFRLEQEPELQSALVSIDPHRQYLVAMVGGYDFDANEFNRAFQACRQPGSSFKPLVYSAAVEGWGKLKENGPKTEATVIVDSPIVFDDASTGVRWKPQNFEQDFQGDVVLRTAIVNSMNVPAIKTFADVGTLEMAEWAKRMGLERSLQKAPIVDSSAALGSACVYPAELAGVYATFARMGVKKPTYFVRKIEDRFGRRIEDHTSYEDPWATLEDRVGGAYAALLQPGERVMSKEAGFITVDLLRSVVRDGTGGPAQRLGKPAAGKTGTTNDAFDTWFAGFTRDLVTVAWIGYDLNPHPLNKYETGGRASLPIWLNYMKVALDGRQQPEFSPPPGADLVMLRIDEKSGEDSASSGSKSVKPMWFKRGTEPKDAEVEKGQVDQNQFMMQ